MYYIVVYDIANEKRLPKVLKICRKYLHWVQNSVFEGELNDAQYHNFTTELNQKIKKEEDSIIVYKLRDEKWMKRCIIGLEKSEISTFI